MYNEYMDKMNKHLKSRFFDTTKYSGLSLTDETLTVMLWNLSGQCVGYQCYTPSLPKLYVDDPRLARYYTWVTKPCASKNAELAVWGLETVDWTNKILFLTEGVFDACRLHWHGLPAVACLTNNPVHLTSWLKALPSVKVACVQGDAAGKKLANFGNSCVMLPENNDVGSLSDAEFTRLFAKYL